MNQLSRMILIISLISFTAFALPVDKNTVQEKNSISESAKSLIQLNLKDNQNQIISQQSTAAPNNKQDLIASLVSTCCGCNCIENTDNNISLNVDCKLVNSSQNPTASLVNGGSSQPNWLK